VFENFSKTTKYYMSKYILGLIIVLFNLNAFAQKKNDNYKYFIKKTTEKVKIDGVADDAVWSKCQVASDFFQVLPMDTSKAKVNTEVKFTYDDKNLYVLFINHNYYKGNNIVESMKRDWNFSKNDNDLLFIDTFNDQTTGYTFGSNARGGQWDGLMSAGSNISLSWDNKWQSEVSFDDDKWTWEAAIPFKTLRYKSDVMSWGLNLSRQDLKTTEKSAWTPVPRQFPTSSLAFSGNLVWDMPPPAPGANISIIPFVYGGVVRDFEKKLPAAYDKGVGFDAKIGLTSSMNLDLTVNPDFSQVEVDVQQTNLDRFELFFPERRQFFLENGDIFNNYGTDNIRPFFSRRIGLNAPIFYGGKVSGKINNNWRLGAMNLQTGKSASNDPGSNYSILSLQRKVFKRSYVSFLYTDRETILSKRNEDSLNNIPSYNRTAGLEYNLASADNKWKGKALYLKTFSPDFTSQNNVSVFNIARSLKKYSTSLTLENVDKDVKGNEIGFIRRQNYVYGKFDYGYLFFPKGGKILSHGPSIMTANYVDKASRKLVENTHFLSYNIGFRTQASFTIWTATDFVRLQRKFDPTNYVKQYLDSAQVHTWASWGTIFASRPQKLFTYSFETRYGGYYAQGKRLRLDAEVAYRFQPYVALAFKSNYNRLSFFDGEQLPDALKNTTHNLWLLGPRIDVTFSNKLFFTNFVQYNKQTNNVNINTRFQWRYSPASDLFLVYTDNYTSDTFQVRNRAIVLKFTYWWNV
jgi:hypothetical protein